MLTNDIHYYTNHAWLGLTSDNKHSHMVPIDHHDDSAGEIMVDVRKRVDFLRGCLETFINMEHPNHVYRVVVYANIIPLPYGDDSIQYQAAFKIQDLTTHEVVPIYITECVEMGDEFLYFKNMEFVEHRNYTKRKIN